VAKVSRSPRSLRFLWPTWISSTGSLSRSITRQRGSVRPFVTEILVVVRWLLLLAGLLAILTPASWVVIHAECPLFPLNRLRDRSCCSIPFKLSQGFGYDDVPRAAAPSCGRVQSLQFAPGNPSTHFVLAHAIAAGDVADSKAGLRCVGVS